MIEHCRTCALRNEAKQVCQLTGIPINLDIDYCSKHTEDLTNVCDMCGSLMLAPGFVESDAEGKVHIYCHRCNQLFSTCQLCDNVAKCEFETNPDPMPKVVMKTVRQGNMVMQTQVRNEERMKKICPSCSCWSDEFGCLKEFNIGCLNKKTSRES